MRQSTPSARAARLAMALASGPSACALIYAANYQLCEALRLCRYFRALLRRAVSRGIGTALAPLGLKNGIDSLKKPATQLTRTRSRQRWPGKRPWRQRSTPSRRRKISSVYVVLSFESSSCGELLKWTGSTSAPAAPLGAVPSDAAGSAPAAAAARTHVADTFGASRAGPMKHDGSRRGSPAPAGSPATQL